MTGFSMSVTTASMTVATWPCSASYQEVGCKYTIMTAPSKRPTKVRWEPQVEIAWSLPEAEGSRSTTAAMAPVGGQNGQEGGDYHCSTLGEDEQLDVAGVRA